MRLIVENGIENTRTCLKRRAMSNLDKYIQMAKDLKMANARIISPDDIYFDIRAILKCRWGCEDFFNQTIKCNTRNTSYRMRREWIKMKTFADKAYDLLRKVPKGRVTTYREIAHALESRAYRAVGQAMKKNPYAPEVP